MMKNKAQSGITFMELLLIITVLTVITVIVFPKFKMMVIRAREGRTKSGLAEMRGSLSIYYSDNFGLYPSDKGTPETRLVDTLTPKYMPAIPSVELSHLYGNNKNTVQDRFDDQGDWVYSRSGGYIAVNSLKTDSRGRSISGW